MTPPLYVEPSAHPDSDDIDVKISLGQGNCLGTLVIPHDHLAEFMTGLQRGFKVVISG